MIELVKALHGLKSSARAFHKHLADTLRSMGFKPTHFDNDVWLKERSDGTGHDCVSTHVDDVLCAAKDPQKCMDKLAEKCNLHDVGPPTHCLGNSHTKLDGRWLMSAIICQSQCENSQGSEWVVQHHKDCTSQLVCPCFFEDRWLHMAHHQHASTCDCVQSHRSSL